MFEKLTTRERNLAYAVIGLAPAVLIFIGVFWFLGQSKANGVREAALLGQIFDEELKLAKGKKATCRRAFYDSISLPVDIDNASNDYQSWIKGLVRDELQMNFKALTPTDASDLKNKAEVVGKRRYYMLRADGTLDQLTSFLTRFYSAELLHRINSLKIIAQNETAGSKKKIRTGMLGITAKIEVLSLSTAVNDAEFLRQFHAERATESRFAETNQAYRDMVMRRDIFGPPNNTPTVTATPKSSYVSETEAEIKIAAKDADEEDMMNFEIIDAPIEGWELVQSNPEDRTVRLTVPGQKAGRYKFTVKVSDDGFPAKETTKEFTVTFKDKVIAQIDLPTKPDPPFINAKETTITGIVMERTGDWRVWIKVRTTGDRHKLKVGESFELDKKKWVVEEIKPEYAVFRVDNRLVTFEPTDRFVDPRNEIILDVPVTSEVKEIPETDTKLKIESDAAPKPRTSI